MRAQLPPFPIDVHLDPARPPVVGQILDLSPGGARLRFPRYLELFTRAEVEFDVPLTLRDGGMESLTVRAVAAVVWIDPEEEADAARDYVVAVEFARLDEAGERAIGLCMLQRVLYDEDAGLT